jgi:hypothetical protein
MDIKPLNSDHVRNIGISMGLTAAMNYLADRAEVFEKLPGYNSARALIQELEAQQRAHVAGMNFRAAAAAGVDISTHMIGLIGPGKIYAEPMDVEQLAEFAPAGETS